MILTIYMKSGNAIKLTGIDEYKIENRGNEIVGVTLKQKPKILGIFPRDKLLVKTIAMDQIEAVTCDA